MLEALDSLNVHGYAAYAMARDLVAQKQQQQQVGGLLLGTLNHNALILYCVGFAACVHIVSYVRAMSCINATAGPLCTLFLMYAQ